MLDKLLQEVIKGVLGGILTGPDIIKSGPISSPRPKRIKIVDPKTPNPISDKIVKTDSITMELTKEYIKRQVHRKRARFGFNPTPGTPVFCDLAVAVEHTGIYIGRNRIVHLEGDGNIRSVSPEEFVARLDGKNPSRKIYFAANNDKSLGNTEVAQRARNMRNGFRNYNVLLDNCHQFTCGCLSGNFENPCNFFWLVEQEIKSQNGIENFVWQEWKY